MSTNEHPITPPPELVEKWYDAIDNSSTAWKQKLANAAAQWGSDKELEACCEWMQSQGHEHEHTILYSFRRPKPQTLNSIALEMLGTIEKMDVVIPEITDTIRRAIEALPND
jgi:hypothetical protein